MRSIKCLLLLVAALSFVAANDHERLDGGRLCGRIKNYNMCKICCLLYHKTQPYNVNEEQWSKYKRCRCEYEKDVVRPTDDQIAAYEKMLNEYISRQTSAQNKDQ
jgi:hypothetical protein